MKKLKKSHIVLVIISIVLAIPLLIFLSFIRLDAYLPHEKAQIILPFEQQYDDVTTIIPMGETIHHPKPDSPYGHPGIDFGSQVAYPYIASIDGTISKITNVEGSGNEIILNNGVYNIVYAEMDPENTYVVEGQKVKQGDKIALSYPKDDDNNKHYSTHWEFASISVLRDRFCPTEYFTQESRDRIEAIWARVKASNKDQLTTKFPDICSGDYYGRVE